MKRNRIVGSTQVRLWDIKMKVRLKSLKEILKMERAGEITTHHSDSGEWITVCTIGNPSHCQTFWYEDFGEEFLVVEHEKPISKAHYEIKKNIFVEENE